MVDLKSLAYTLGDQVSVAGILSVAKNSFSFYPNRIPEFMQPNLDISSLTISNLKCPVVVSYFN